MTSPFIFTAKQRESLETAFSEAFFATIVGLLDSYSQRWKLTDLRLVEYYSINCIFTATTEYYGPVVLKICQPDKEVKTETHALMDFKGNRFCQLYDYDLADSVLLIERIVPGTAVRASSDLSERISIFTTLFKSIHQKTYTADVYPTYKQWVKRIAVVMREDQRIPELSLRMQEAEAYMDELSERYHDSHLLHGDLHHDNMLLGSDGYRIIDPKGVIGDPICDVPRFVLNEYQEEDSLEGNESRIKEALIQLHERLSYPLEDLCKMFFIETAMSLSWCVEDGTIPDLGALKIAMALLA